MPQPADLASADPLFHLKIGRCVAAVEPDLQRHARRPARCNRALRIRTGEREGFFSEYMLASLRGGNNLAGVLRMRRSEDDGIDVSIAQHVFVARCQFQSEARGQFSLSVRIACDHSVKADLPALALHGFDEPRAPMACTADCRTQHKCSLVAR